MSELEGPLLNNKKIGLIAIAVWVAFFVTVGSAPVVAFGQAISVNGGSIQGTITDQSGAIIPNAQITITSPETGYNHTLHTDASGFYAVGPLTPGEYVVTVSATGFQQLKVTTVIRTGTATHGSYKLTVGSTTQTIQVNAGAVQLNTDQAGVSDVITSQQIKSLPVNGRNFLDLAAIEPGVLLQQGQDFDPTKAGYSAISVSGVSGRTTRILLDGQDITDETVGTTVFNVSQGSINEFQLNRANQDVSGEVTSTGQVLVTTTSGTNHFHGQLFYNFQDYRAGFAETTGGYAAPFQRNQFGGSVGGPILKDKLFFFANSERIKQDSEGKAQASPSFNQPFAGPGQPGILDMFPTIPSPFRDTYSAGRLDFNGMGGHYFARVNYEVNSVAANFGFLYSIYANRDNTPGYAFGADFQGGHFTHSFRGSYEKFHNMIVDSTSNLGNSIYNPANYGAPGVTLYDSGDGFFAGPNYLAPQGTFQSDKQFRYDGTWTHGAHIFKYGYSLNRILGGGFAEFYGVGLLTLFGQGSLLNQCANTAITGPCPGDPLNGYSTSEVLLGNGNSIFTEKPGFGLPGGGTEDWREGAYIADNWKVTPNFTLTAGLRWSVDTDRANQDLPTPTCASVNPDFNPCPGGGNLFDQYQQGLGKRVHQPYANFGPQVGFTYAPAVARNTVFNAAIGVFYENDIFNNTTNARSSVIDTSGPFWNYTVACGGTYKVRLPDGTIISDVNGVSLETICNEPIAQGAPALQTVKSEYQAATAANNTATNPSYIGDGDALEALGVYGAPYRTPYSLQYNFGIQQQLGRGVIISAEYIHNGTFKVPMIVDVNHVGAARYLNVAAAQNAIALTEASYGCTDIDCVISAGGTIQDFAGNGLDSGNQVFGSAPAAAYGATPDTGAAFPGKNPAVGIGQFILPRGQSGYDALQIVFKEVRAHPFRGVANSSFQASYSLSRIVSDIAFTTSGQGDQFFNNLPYDYDNPKEFMGRNALDHKHELSFGGAFQLKYGPQLALTGHFYSAPPLPLLLDTTAGDAAQIFQTDWTGDGQVADPVPGTRSGSYMHDVKPGTLNKLISNYNSQSAGTPTPAGQALINAGLFTQQQLAALGGVQQPIAQIPGDHAPADAAFLGLDASLSYPIHIGEGMSVEPGIAMYNVANFSNFGTLSDTLLNQVTTGGPTGAGFGGFLNGPDDEATANSIRSQRGAGTYAQGAPRTTEFSLKFNF